jgi:N-sulfoglucosamine sulfohydrolase
MVLEMKRKKVIDAAKVAGKPFFVGVNTSDPHRPFSGGEQESIARKENKDTAPLDFLDVEPVCSVEDVPLLPYLPDLPDIRKETVEYLTTVKRADETLGRVIDLLEAEGLMENTLFIFFSDHAAPVPTAKQNCYAHSSVTPLILSWSGKIQPGSIDRDHMVSTLDLMPTILEALNLPLPKKQDGRSMLSILRGQKQEGRDAVFTSYN